jgi:hypothetical protein
MPSLAACIRLGADVAVLTRDMATGHLSMLWKIQMLLWRIRRQDIHIEIQPALSEDLSEAGSKIIKFRLRCPPLPLEDPRIGRIHIAYGRY